MKKILSLFLILLPWLVQAQAVDNPRSVRRSCAMCKDALYEVTVQVKAGTYPATKAGRIQFQDDILAGKFDLVLDNGAIIQKGVKPPKIPPTPSGLTGPSWASLRYSLPSASGEMLIEGAGSDLAKLRFQRVDGTRITGTNPNGVTLNDADFFAWGPNDDPTYPKQWRVTWSPSVAGYPFRITAQKSDGTLFFKEFAPQAGANKTQLYVASTSTGGGTTTPPTTTTSVVAYDKTIQSEDAQLSNSGQDVFTFPDVNSEGGKIACCFSRADTYIDYTFTGVPASGRLTLVLRFQTNQDPGTPAVAVASIIAGGQTQTVSMDGTGGGKDTKTITVPVTSGDNTIRIAGNTGTFLQDQVRLSGTISSTTTTGGGTTNPGSGNQTVAYKSFTRGVIVGNSITTHSASTAIGWNKFNGMAADSPAQDYAHIVESALQGANPSFTLAKMGQGSGLELYYNHPTDKDAVKNNITNLNDDLAQLNGASATYDLIILSIGENTQNSGFDQTKFRSMLDQLFSSIKINGPPTVVLRNSFWSGNDQANAVLAAYASEKGYKFANLDNIRERADYKASQYSDAGVAHHPNNAGHAAIAGLILDQLKTSSSGGGGTTTPIAGALPGPGTAPLYSNWNSRGANYYGGSAFRTPPSSVPANPRSGFDYPIPATNMAWPTDVNNKVMGDYRKVAVGPVVRLDNGGSVSAEIRLRYGGGVAVYDKASGYQGINWPDHGRQAELTWYGGPKNWSQKYGGQWFNIGYDPIGVGNVGEIGSPVQSLNYVTGNDGKQYLYVRSQLLNWPSGVSPFSDEITGCWLERWIRVEGDKVLVKARLTHDNPDRTNYGGFNQEWPNFMVNGSNKQVAFVTAGGQAGTGNITYSDLIEQGQNDNSFQASHGVPRTFQQTAFHLSEPWQAANLRGKWWGIVSADYFRASNIGYKVWGGGSSSGEDTGDDEAGKPATYLSTQMMIETGPDVTNYTDYAIVVNSDLNQIRSYANSLPQESLNYTFNATKGNNLWYCAQGHQTSPGTNDGWPLVLGEYNQDKGGVTAEFASIQSPVRRWSAGSISTVYVKMAYTGNKNQLTFGWYRNGQKPEGLDPSRPNETAARYPNGSAVGQNTMTFNVIGDGQARTYAIPVSSSGDWRDVIQQVYIKGFTTPNEPIRLIYVGTNNPN